MKVVKDNLKPDTTITLEFQQKKDGKIHERMSLNVKNPFDKQLNYNAVMNILGYEEWLETSIIPVFPNISGYEMWNDIIVSLVLYDWKLGD